MNKALARKAKSEVFLKARGIPINEALPVVELESSIRLRPVDEMVSRVLALCYVVLLGQPDNGFALSVLQARYDAKNKLSPNERALADKRKLTPAEKHDVTWRYEAMAAVLWVLGYLDELPYPDNEIDAELLVNLISPHREKDLIGSAKPRRISQILDVIDLYYRFLWAIRDAEINKCPMPGQLHILVVFQRMYALNWVINYQNSSWDTMTTDT